jgi:ferredoxin-NADP reductase/ferredoxin
MFQLRYNGRTYPVEAGQSVLDALLAHDQAVPNSCRAGVCQSCLVQVTEGEAPGSAQKGLKPTLAAQGYVLACQCQPEGDLAVRLPAAGDLRVPARVTGLRRLAEDVMELRLGTEAPLDYRPGQYVTLWRDAGLGRSYSLASVPGLDEDLCFHVRRVPEGQFSGWLFGELRPGDALEVQGPSGHCFYLVQDRQRPLILAGTGTGLAPLWGIVRDALAQGHTGPIHLFHGALDRAGLYLHDALTALAAAHGNLHYHASVLRGEADEAAGILAEPLEALILRTVPEPKGCTAYLCGAPDFVNGLRKRLFLAGASMNDILADAFLPSTGSAQIQAT